jgi:hypothetical protein
MRPTADETADHYGLRVLTPYRAGSAESSLSTAADGDVVSASQGAATSASIDTLPTDSMTTGRPDTRRRIDAHPFLRAGPTFDIGPSHGAVADGAVRCGFG